LWLEKVEHCRPCDLSVLVRYRQSLLEAAMEELKARTINVAGNLKPINVAQLRVSIVESAVQGKAITHSITSKMFEMACSRLVAAAREQAIELKQTYANRGASLGLKIVRFAHAR
jgi:IS5 family transposase